MNTLNKYKYITNSSYKLYIAIISALILLYLTLIGITSIPLYCAIFLFIIPAILEKNSIFNTLFFFLIPFNNVVYIGTTSIVTILVLIRAAKILSIKKFRNDNAFLILCLISCILLFAAIGDTVAIKGSIRHLFIVTLSLHLFIETNEGNNVSNIEKMIICVSLGVLTTVLFSLYINGFSEKRFSVTEESGKNQLSILCATCIAYLAMLIILNRQKNLIKIAIVALLVFSGFLTISRTFLIVTTFVACWAGIKLLSNSKNIVKNIFVTLFFLAFIYFSFSYIPFLSNMLDKTFTRVENLEIDHGGGRHELWKIYLDVIFSSKKVLLFGIGNPLDYGIESVAHSMWIESLAEYGLIGCLLFIINYVFATRKILKINNTCKNTWFSFLPLLSFLLSLTYSHSPIGNINTIFFFLSIYAIPTFSKIQSDDELNDYQIFFKN